MSDVATEVRFHEAFRSVACCLCGRGWEEQFVGVALLNGQRVLGDLCPRCLDEGPRRAVTQISQYERTWGELWEQLAAPPDRPREDALADWRRLKARINDLAQESASLSSITGFLLARSAALHRESRRLRSELGKRMAESLQVVEASQTRRRPADDDSFSDPAAADEELLSHLAERLSQFAEDLTHLSRWPTTVAQCIESERRCFLRHFAGLDDAGLRRMVDERYSAFLAASA